VLLSPLTQGGRQVLVDSLDLRQKRRVNLLGRRDDRAQGNWIGSSDDLAIWSHLIIKSSKYRLKYIATVGIPCES
jgi:hypothetical protein